MLALRKELDIRRSHTSQFIGLVIGNSKGICKVQKNGFLIKQRLG